MRLVISGANGFLGKNLVNHIAHEEFEFVRLLDIHYPDENTNLKCKYDRHAIDLSSPDLSDLITSNDVVIHLAWRSNPAVTGADVNTESELNWIPSSNLIDVCVQKNAKLIFISSGGVVYGKSMYLPIDEDHPTNPISAYGEVKLRVEKMILRKNQETGLQYVILRPSNLYGPGFSTKKGLGVIGHWVEKIRDNESIQIIGDGEQVRDFIHVDDLSRAILKCLTIENEIFNVGTGDGVSLNQLKSLFESAIGKEIEVVRTDSRSFDVNQNVLSVKKIKRLTSWRPKIDLIKGIKDLIA
jgi:UDP-glucose 4-epimerase